MRTIIYEKTLSIIFIFVGFLGFVFVKFRTNLIFVLLLFILLGSEQSQSHQIILNVPTLDFGLVNYAAEKGTISTGTMNLNENGSSATNDLAQPLSVSEKAVKVEAVSMSIDQWKKVVSTKGMKSNELEKFEYLKRYAQVSVDEMRIHGIPASITIAQALLESNAGRSNLARKHKNHFGIKCYDQKSRSNACVSFYSDGPDDHFRNYESVWSCFRDHSYFLKKERYSFLYELDKKDYAAWAKGLSKAGYATDKNYAQKLTKIIERWDLHLLDQV